MIYNLDQPFYNHIKVTDIFHKKEDENDKKREERFQVTPRKRKSQRNLEKIDQILDDVRFSKNKDILKLRNSKPE